MYDGIDQGIISLIHPTVHCLEKNLTSSAKSDFLLVTPFHRTDLPSRRYNI